MKILFTLPRQHPNQAGWYYALTNTGHEVKYLTSYSLPVNERSDLPEPTVITRDTMPFWYKAALRIYSWLFKKKIQEPYLHWPDKSILEKQIISFSPDIIVIRETLTPLSLLTQSIAHKYKIKTVHYSQASLAKKDGVIFKLLRGLQIVPSYIITPTLPSKSKEEFHERNFYLPLFVSSNIKEPSSINENKIKLLFVGKYNSRRKKHLMLLEAVSLLPNLSSVHVTLAGSTVFEDREYEEEISNCINKLKLSGHVSLKRDINPAEMSTLYKNHDAFVLPSINEPFSISPLEAMAHGLPVIVTDSNGCQFHIKDGLNGYVIKSNDINALVNSLKKLTDPENLVNMKKSALNYSQNVNNEKLFIEKFNEMINVVTNST